MMGLMSRNEIVGGVIAFAGVIALSMLVLWDRRHWRR